jgi:hypothetical protein
MLVARNDDAEAVVAFYQRRNLERLRAGAAAAL